MEKYTKDVKEKDFKFNEESKLMVIEDDGFVDMEIIGMPLRRRKTKKYIADADICIGSVAEPNTKIISLVYGIPYIRKWRKI